MTSQQLGDALRELRRRADLTQQALATRAGLHANTIIRMEGNRPGTTDHLLRLLAELGYTIQIVPLPEPAGAALPAIQVLRKPYQAPAAVYRATCPACHSRMRFTVVARQERPQTACPYCGATLYGRPETAQERRVLEQEENHAHAR